MIRIASALLAVCAVVLAIVQFEPAIFAANARIASDTGALRSDDVAFSSLAQLERKRQLLLIRYGRSPGGVEAGFLRELGGIARRHGVRVIATSFKRDVTAATETAGDPGEGDADARFFTRDSLSVTLRGPYARTLAAIADLSTGARFVRVDRPNVTRGEAGVVAVVPLALLVPVGAAP